MDGYSLRTKRAARIGAALMAAAVLALIVSVSLGDMRIPPGRVAEILWAKLSGTAEMGGFKQNELAVVWEIRLPRVLLGFFVGAGLAAAGAIFQSLLGNPLADPYTLGVSTGAALGATAVIFLNVTYGMSLPPVPAALSTAVAALFVVILMAQRGGGLISSNLVIAGMIVSAILSSAISFLKMLAGENVSAIVYWLMGSLSGGTWADVRLLAPAVVLGAAAALPFAGDLNAMTLGDRAASALGVNVARTRLILLLAGSLITAVSVSVSGIIGFVGLIVPHMLRLAASSDNRRLLPLSFLAGGLLLMLADDAARLIGNGDIPVGVLTTLLGGPFFIRLFLRRGR
jgi:iron complex transport system permease protein